MTRFQISSCFVQVKQRYFPRWDAHCEWKVIFGKAPHCRDATGYCDSKAMRIYLDDCVCEITDAGATGLLIHEICHDVAAAGHNRRWADAMGAAAMRAEHLGEGDVASMLRADIFSYAGDGVSQPYSLLTVLDWLESLPLDQATPSFDKVTKDLAKHLGVSSAKLRRDFGSVIHDCWPIVSR